MKALRQWTLAILGLLLGAACVAAEGEGVETWTSRAGQSVEAAFVEIGDDDMVVLRTTEGELLRIARTALDPAGQERARALADEQAERLRREAVEAVDAFRAVIPEAYRHPRQTVLGRVDTPRFTAVVYAPSGALDYFIKEEGRYLAPPIRIRLAVGYYDDAQRQHRQRNLVELVEPPTFRDRVARFKMQLDDGVYAETVVAILDDGLDLGYHVRDPQGITYASRGRLALAFPAIFREDIEADPPVLFSPRFPAGIDRQSFMEHVAPYEIMTVSARIRGPEGVHQFPYNRGVERLGYGLARIEVGGGVFGGTTVRVDLPRRGGILSGYIYPESLPAEGFSIHYQREQPTGPVDRATELLPLRLQD